MTGQLSSGLVSLTHDWSVFIRTGQSSSGEVSLYQDWSTFIRRGQLSSGLVTLNHDGPVSLQEDLADIITNLWPEMNFGQTLEKLTETENRSRIFAVRDRGPDCSVLQLVNLDLDWLVQC